MGEDDIVELIWKSGQIVRHSQTQRPSVTPPTTILRGSGSGGGGGEEIAPLPPLPPHPPLMTQQQPSDQNLFIREDEMASWLHHPLREDEFRSHLFYSGGVVSITSTQPQGSVYLTPPLPLPPSALYTPTAERPMGQTIAATRAENFTHFSRLRGNIYTGGTVEAAGPWIPVVRDSTQVGSNATPSCSASDSCLTPATVTGVVSQTFALPGLSQKAIETVCEMAGPSPSGVSKGETEPIQIQLAIETETTDDRKRKEREETVDEIEETAEQARGSTSRKRSRTAEMHNISERRRREKINERIKALQELIPRCNKTDKASVLDDAIEYMKLLQMQIQMMMMGGGGMMPMMYTSDMQRFMPRMGTGMMGMNRPPFIPFPGTPFPRPAHMAGLGPPYPPPRYPFPNIQPFDPSRVPLQSQQPDPMSSQPQFPGYLNPYSQFVGFQQMQQPPPLQQLQQPPSPPLQQIQQPHPPLQQIQQPHPPLQQIQQPPPLQQMQQPPPLFQNQTTSQLSSSQATSSKEPEDQDNKPAG